MAYPAWFALQDEESEEVFDAYYTGDYIDVTPTSAKARQKIPGLRTFYLRGENELEILTPDGPEHFKRVHGPYRNRRLRKINL